MLPAVEIIFVHRTTRASAHDICHAHAYALLQLHVIVCSWSWAVCAWELDWQPPRPVTTKGRHVVCSSGLELNSNRSNSDYDTGTSMIFQVMVFDNHPRANSKPCRSYKSHPGKHVRKICIIQIPTRQVFVKDLHHTDPIGEKLSRSRRSYRSHQSDMI